MERFEDVVKSYTAKYIDIPEELLWSLYWGQDMSTSEIAKIFGCTNTTIRGRMIEYGIPRRTPAGVYTDFEFDDKQRQIFEGCMLGDGRMSLPDGYNYPLLNYFDAHKEYLPWLAGKLGITDISVIVPVYRFKGALSPCGYFLTTRVIPSLRGVYPSWYPDGKGTREYPHNKVFPSDMVLTPTSLLFWYLGDGYYHKSNKAIRLTSRLDYNMAMIFLNKIASLLEIESDITINRDYDRYIIRIGKKRASKFLDSIVQDDIPECYWYKFPGYFGG